jgi:menaquinone-dependent protoporphyrinogen oxidase
MSGRAAFRTMYASTRRTTMRALVTAASRYGATREIAEAIGDELRLHGLTVDVLDPEQVDSVRGYDAVVLGSAVYTGHWLAPATDLAARVSSEMAACRVWLFSSGPVGDPARGLVQKMGADPVDLPELVRQTRALEHRMFSGRLDRARLGHIQRFALCIVRGLDGDFRDWPAIRLWADEIAETLTPAHRA